MKTTRDATTLTIILLAVSLVASLLSVRANAQSIADVRWIQWSPRVIAHDSTVPVTLTLALKPGSLAAPWSMSLRDGDQIQFQQTGPETYEAVLTAEQVLFQHVEGDARNFVGYLEAPGPCPPLQNGCFNLFMNIRTTDMPDVPIVNLGNDSRASRHVMNLRQKTVQQSNYPDAQSFAEFYKHFDDRFDFIVFVDMVNTIGPQAAYLALRNEESGIGRPIFDNATALGSPSRLLGMIFFRGERDFDLANRTALHELGHQWINWLEFVALGPNPWHHWPLSDVAYGLMGFQTPLGGGYFPWELIVQGNGDVLVQGLPQPTEFNDLELYLMGMVPASEVSDHFVLPNQDPSTISDGAVLPGPVDWVTIADIIAGHGIRMPSDESSRKSFNIATVVLSGERFLSADEWAFFDHMAARASARTELPVTQGFFSGMTKPFHLATGGRGYLSSVVIEHLSRVSGAGDVNGDGSTDLGVLIRDPAASRNRVLLMDGATGNELASVPFGPELSRAYLSVPDLTGDDIPEPAVLVQGSVFARVKNFTDDSLLGKPPFDPAYWPIAFLSVGDANGDTKSDVAVVAREASTGRVRAQVKSVEAGSLISRVYFDKNYDPFDAVVLDNIAAGAANEIAVLGVDSAGRVRAQVKDAQTGSVISRVYFDKTFTPLAFAALPDSDGYLTYIGVLAKNDAGMIRAQIKRAVDGELVGLVRFDSEYKPIAFLGFIDSNSNGAGGEVAVVGVNASGNVRAQIKEIGDASLVSLINFDKDYLPIEAIGVNGVAGTGMNEIAVFGVNASNQHQLQIKDVVTGTPIRTIPLQ